MARNNVRPIVRESPGEGFVVRNNERCAFLNTVQTGDADKPTKISGCRHEDGVGQSALLDTVKKADGTTQQLTVRQRLHLKRMLRKNAIARQDSQSS